ncbi:MAG: archease [Candidatus Bathyarchaeota archaeon]|nr:archease [Candidatus Bathyarchaeota archaeon]
MNTPKFKIIEHVSDVYVAAYGKTMEEAFENAALAMFQSMTDTDLVEPKIKVEVCVEEEDEKALLYSWLESLLIKFGAEGMLFSKFKIYEIKRFTGGFKLKGEAWGEQFNPEKHPSKVEVKAVTYHSMEIEKENDLIVVKVLFDI